VPRQPSALRPEALRVGALDHSRGSTDQIVSSSNKYTGRPNPKGKPCVPHATRTRRTYVPNRAVREIAS